MWQYWHFGIIESAKSVNNVNLRDSDAALIFREKGCWKQFLRTF